MKPILNKLFEYQYLSKNEAKETLLKIAQQAYNDSEIASFLTVFLMRPLCVNELFGFREALLELAVKIDFSDFNTIDLCGTGGDEKNTFNISTLTAFVVAGAGYKVAKHGNYSVSSASGSSNVLENLGCKFSNDQEKLKKQLSKANICFLHAPLFHPAMKAVGPVRKALGIKTFFNILGPLVNPSMPKNQLVGVFNLQTARLYHQLLQQGKTNFSVVHSIDGYDEISLTGPFKLLKRNSEELITPQQLGQNQLKQSQIFGGNTVEQAVAIFKTIIAGKGTDAQNSVVLTNASFALQTIDPALSFDSAYEKSKSSLLGLKAKQSLEKIISKKL